MKKKQKHGYDRANIFSRWYCLFAWDFLWQNYRNHHLNIDRSFDDCSQYDECLSLGNSLEKNWNQELANGENQSLLRALFKTFKWRYLRDFMFNILIYGALRMIMPICLGRLIHHANVYRETTTNESSSSFNYVLIYATMLSLVIFLNFAFSQPYFMCNYRLGMNVRVALTKLIYDKSLRITQSVIQRMTIGKIVNLISTDCCRFDVTFTAIYFLFGAIIHCAVGIILLNLYIGKACTGAIIIVMLYLPCQVGMANILSRFRSKSIQLTDDRLCLMSEILPAMRVIKMYCWEKPFALLVTTARRLEIVKIRNSLVLRSINLAVFFVSNKVIAFVCLVWFLESTGQRLTAELVFVSLSLIFQIRESMTFFFPMAVSYGVESYISLRRIQRFLLEEEKTPIFTSQNTIFNDDDDDQKSMMLSLKSVTVYGQNKNVTIVNDVSFDAKAGQLTVIAGQVGSGKSSILLSIIGEYRMKTGSINAINIESMRYVSQESWIFAGTIRENILFGSRFESKRYWKVIQVAALEADLNQMIARDQTSVDDRGTSLSGGQRARISLARALYADPDCLLLDDPLSAVDTTVAKHIFEQCIKKYLKQKLVILVTHQLQFIKQADQIIVLKNGSCLAKGTYETLLNKGIDIYKYAETSSTTNNDHHHHHHHHHHHQQQQQQQQQQHCEQQQHIRFNSINSFNSELFVRSRTISLISSTASTISDMTNIADYNRIEYNDQQQQQSAINNDYDNGGEKSNNKIKVYWRYVRMGAGFFLLSTMIISNIVTQILFTGTDYWLSLWTDHQENVFIMENIDENHRWQHSRLIMDNHNSNLMIYGSLVILLFIFSIIRTTSFFMICMRASVRLHNTMFDSLLKVPILFFDKTPIGVIMNRVSRDLGIIDDLLPPVAFEALEILGNSLAVFILCTSFNYLILIPLIILLIIFYLMIRFYVNTARNIKRMESIARSPLFQQMSSTLTGLSTIRSYKAETMFKERLIDKQNKHSSILLTFLSSSRLFGISMEIMCLLYINCLLLFLILNIDQYSGSLIGLIISQSFSLTSSFNWGVRQMTEVETFMTSVERLFEFNRLDHERSVVDENDNVEIDLTTKKQQWPQYGQIRFDNVCLYYCIEKPVLINLSFTINGAEKIGVVGRTGAGKSSLITILFRLMQPTSGNIYIDDVDTGKISLNKLRKNLSIIPQEPVLFSGTVRYNLDPFNEKDDHQIWMAIDKVQLKSKIESLDSIVSDFSVGEKQLICMARAILRKNKILILDEATANVDPRTDSFIQQTIRTEFKDCTVLTIAHRLNTIIDYDRILVLDNGRLMQFDTPHRLIEQEHGIFYELFNNLNDDIKIELRQMAAAHR